MFKKSDTPAVAGGKISNILGPDTSYKGTLKSDGNVRVDGAFEGLIETAGNVVIGPSAKVLADIVASSVQVWGAVCGNITAQGRLEILSTGRVWGDVKVTSMLIDEGGMFRGQCLMAAENVEPPTLPGLHAQEGLASGTETEAKAGEITAPSAVTPAEPAEGLTPSADTSAEQPETPTAGTEMPAKSMQATTPVSAPRSRRRAASPPEDKGAF